MTTPDPTRAAEYRDLLTKGILPFWFRHGADLEYGGVMSAMREDGTRVSEDKYLWSQGRWLWLLSALCNRLERRPEWLEAARRTRDFLLRHGRDGEGRWLFAVSRTGEPRIGPTSIFADCFAIHGLNEYARATGDEEALAVALCSFQRVRRRVEEPDFSEIAPQSMPAGRKPHAVPMILTDVASGLARTTGDPAMESAAGEYAMRVMDHFVRPEWRVLVEYLDTNYQLLAAPEGTAVEPGHAIECMWFVIHWARRTGREDIVRRAVEVIRWHIELGWDAEYGGIFLAVDAEGQAPYIAHADKKVWWVHSEALYALALAGSVSGEDWCEQWYSRVHDWAQAHFARPEWGEWYQRLDRQGREVTDVVALPVKDPFHLARAALLMTTLFESPDDATLSR